MATITGTTAHSAVTQAQMAEILAHAQAWSNPTLNIVDDVETQSFFAAPPQIEPQAFQHLQSFASAVSTSKYKKPKPMAQPDVCQKKPLQEIYSYGRLNFEKTKCKSFESDNPLTEQPYPWCTTYGIVGIEVEVENIRVPVTPTCYWTAKPDGSLRNYGTEFVSIPLQIKQVQGALKHLFDHLHANNTPDFSNRTSIHIHLNCRDLTQDQLWVLCILYCLFEKHYYSFAGTKRLNSIFCVPVYRSNILSKLNTNVYSLVSEWQKYCGLNILPLLNNSVTGTYGTIEFRHLSGTSNRQAIMAWIDNIMALRKAALEITKPELVDMLKDMNTSSSYKFLYARLFKESDRLLTTKRDFEECISHTKREIFGNEYSSTINLSDRSQYWELSRELGLRG